MSQVGREPGLTDRLEDRPQLSPGKIARVLPRELAYRFIAGALTSIAAGAATLVFGPRAGGILLAFPAILAASLTLIEEQEDSVDAREDARGAIVGAGALAAFAGVAGLALGHLDGALALLIATATWIVAALLGYALSWWR
jgi:hypothetical protein